MKEFSKALIAYLSPRLRDCIEGVALGYDPIPRCYRKTFAGSDVEAFVLDYQALLLDGYEVASKLSHQGEPPSEVHHFWGRRSAAAEKKTRGRGREAV